MVPSQAADTRSSMVNDDEPKKNQRRTGGGTWTLWEAGHGMGFGPASCLPAWLVFVVEMFWAQWGVYYSTLWVASWTSMPIVRGF